MTSCYRTARRKAGDNDLRILDMAGLARPALSDENRRKQTCGMPNSGYIVSKPGSSASRNRIFESNAPPKEKVDHR
jgi:hypothetical protein